VIGTLVGELSGDLEAFRQIREEIEESVAAARAEPANQMMVDALAVRLHRLYGCVEDIAYRISVHINGELPGGSQSHKELLDRTGAEVPGKRRALWSRAPLEDLHELRKFQDFFRTRYAVKLDRDKVLAVADLALLVMPLVGEDVRSFMAYLSKRDPGN
jgi:hypothetical protein